MDPDSELNSWDPMKDDYKNRNFNSYGYGGYGASADAGTTLASASDRVTLFVRGIPDSIHEDGLSNLLSSQGHVYNVKLVPDKNIHNKSIGFVVVKEKDALQIIGKFNNYPVGGSYLGVQVSRNDRNKGAPNSGNRPDGGGDRQPIGRGAAWKNVEKDLEQNVSVRQPYSRGACVRKAEDSDSSSVEKSALNSVASSHLNSAVKRSSPVSTIPIAGSELKSSDELAKEDLRAASSPVGIVSLPAADMIQELSIPVCGYPSAAKYLRKGDVINVEVLDIVTPTQFWVRNQSTDELSELVKLEQAMNQHYSSLTMKSGFRPTGSRLYAAKDGENWCRVQALDFNTTSVKVLYLDSGKCGRVTLTNLHSLEGQFLTLPFQAMLCSLAGVAGLPCWHRRAVDFMRELIMYENILKATVCETDGPAVQIELTLSTGHVLNNLLVLCSHAMATSAAASCAPYQRAASKQQAVRAGVPSLSDITCVTLDEYHLYSVTILHSVSASDITVCLNDDLSKLVDLKVVLNQAEHVTPHVPCRGELVSAKFAVDNEWYRAEVLAVFDDIVVVRYVDFGGTDVLGTHSISRLERKFLDYPVYGIQVELAETLSATWLKFEDLGGVCPQPQIEVLDKQADRYVVRMTDAESGRDVSSYVTPLTEPSAEVGGTVPLASSLKRVNLTVGKIYKAIVCDATDHNGFYVQVNEFCYQPIEKHMKVFHARPGGYVPKKTGEIVVVRTVDDNDIEEYHRGSVCKVKGDLVQCQLVDFGSYDWFTSSDVYRIDANSPLLSYAVTAFQCAFPDVSVSGKVWLADYLNPQTGIYKLKVLGVLNGLHIVSLVCSKSGHDMRTKLINDGILVDTKNELAAGGKVMSCSGAAAGAPLVKCVENPTAVTVGKPAMVDGDTNRGQLLRPRTVEMSPVTAVNESLTITVQGLAKATSDTNQEQLRYSRTVQRLPACAVVEKAQPVAGSKLVVAPNDTNKEPFRSPRTVEVSLAKAVEKLEITPSGSGGKAPGSASNSDKELLYASKSVDGSSANAVEKPPIVPVGQPMVPSSATASWQSANQPTASTKCLMALSDDEIRTLCQNGSKVTMVYANSPCDFFIQCIDTQQAYQTARAEVIQYCMSSTAGYWPTVVGEVVAVPFEDLWYRAEVLKVTSSECHVQFVDFGNEVVVTARNEIRRLPAQLSHSLPRQVIRCAIDRIIGTEVDGSWPAEIIEWFRQTCLEHLYSFKYIFKSKNGNYWEVDLIEEPSNKSVRNLLLSRNVALPARSKSTEKNQSPVGIAPNNHRVPQTHGAASSLFVKPASSVASSVETDNERPGVLHNTSAPAPVPAAPPVKRIGKWQEPPRGTDVDVSVVYVTSPSDFYVQLGDLDALMKLAVMMNELTEYCSLPETAKYVPSQVHEPVAAKFEDGWYRAEVLELLPGESARVIFVDYGNCEVVKAENVRKLPEKFVDCLPWQAIPCALGGIKGNNRGVYGTKATDCFKEAFGHGDVVKLKVVQGVLNDKCQVDLSYCPIHPSAVQKMLIDGYAVVQ